MNAYTDVEGLQLLSDCINNATAGCWLEVTAISGRKGSMTNLAWPQNWEENEVQQTAAAMTNMCKRERECASALQKKGWHSIRHGPSGGAGEGRREGMRHKPQDVSRGGVGGLDREETWRM